MPGATIEEVPKPRRTLLCVLDWGLGHAARSLALLDHPLLAGDEVVIATSGPAKTFFERERPELTIRDLPPYRVRYPTSSMPLNVALQLPKWAGTVWREHQITERLVAELKIDRIISDNRFGCYATGVPSVFLTHQLHPITGVKLVNALYRRYLSRFDAFWVPDQDDRRLSGRLSSAERYENVRYVGPLSRFGRLPAAAPTIKTLSLLSGPEPMRGRLEERLLRIIPGIPGRHVVVRGTTATRITPAPDNVEVIDFADTKKLEHLFPRAEFIICRAGYSTLMDLAAAGVGAGLIFIPTPGQTEQEYLARSLVRSGWGKAVLGQGELTLEALDSRL